MDGEVKLPETIWLIWSKKHEGIYHPGRTIKYVASSKNDALHAIDAIIVNHDIPPSDLIPIEVRITPA